MINGIQGIVRKVTKEYLDCQRNKLVRYKPYRRLNLVKVLEGLQEIISWDFIIKLLKLEDSITG